MNQINDNNPAFPVHWDYETFNPGMTLRDYFAAKAMQSMLLSVEQSAKYELDEVSLDVIHDAIAAWSYSMADAMLKVRKL